MNIIAKSRVRLTRRTNNFGPKKKEDIKSKKKSKKMKPQNDFSAEKKLITGIIPCYLDERFNE